MKANNKNRTCTNCNQTPDDYLKNMPNHPWVKLQHRSNLRKLNLDLAKIGRDDLNDKLLCPACYNQAIRAYEFPNEYKLESK